MFSIFQKIKSIKVKLLIQYGVIILLTSFLVGAMFLSLRKISNFSETRTTSQDAFIKLLQLRKSEKNFILEDITNENFFENNISENITEFNKLENQLLIGLKQINQSDVADKLDLKDSINSLINTIKLYSSNFGLETKEYQRKGYKNWGIEGRLREAIHKIEKGNLPYDKVMMLTLRRCEKDFLLRKDRDYVKKFDKEIKAFQKSLTLSKNTQLISYLNIYKNEFHKVVDSEIKLGLGVKEGLKYGMTRSFSKAESLLNDINFEIKEYVNKTIVSTYIILAVLFLIQLLIAVFLAVSFSNSTSKSIQVIKDSISELSNGNFPDKINTAQMDEIGQASVSFNNLIDRISVASSFAQKIEAGELNISYDVNYSDDVLAKSLQAMHFQLKKVSDENEKRNWINEGLAKFVDLSRDTTDIKRFYNVILSNIIRYIGANQGYLYVLNDENPEIENQFMEVKAVYAYGKEKYLEEKKQIKYQQGLIGQAWFDMESLYFTEIPENYVSITSGMGDATPTCIFICPLIVNDQIVGVIEIATFEKLEKHKIEFVRKISETIASTISSVKTNEKTIALLEQSQLLTEDLREQEEEIRQNMEEMHATQEEMSRKERELNRKIVDLERQLGLISQEN